MSIKDILVQVDNTKACHHRLNVVRNLADRFDSHVAGMYVSPPIHIPAYTGVAVPTLAVAALQDHQENLEKEARKAFDEMTDAWERKISWNYQESEIATAITADSGVHDLVVLGQYDNDDDNDINVGVVDRVVIECGRPVLVIPHSHSDTGSDGNIAKRIVVAWNGKRESIRAIHDAMPFLEKAESVNIVSVSQPGYDELPGAGIAEHIARHGINVETENLPNKGGSVGEILLDTAKRYSADMIVMGAYGHTRFREMVLGGATHHVLKKSDVLVLMSH